MTRSKACLVWLVAFFVVYVAIAWTVNDYAVCVSSQIVEQGQEPVIHPPTCQ